MEKNIKCTMKVFMKLKFTQIRSAIGITSTQKGNLASLKLGKIGQISIFPSSKEVLGRVRIVKHLLNVEEVK